jgi:hypothetical protein
MIDAVNEKLENAVTHAPEDICTEPDVSEEELDEARVPVEEVQTNSGHRIKEHVIEIDTSNPDVIFTTSYNRSTESWDTRIKIGVKYLPKIQHTTPLS